MPKNLCLKLFLAILCVQLLVAQEAIPQSVKKDYEEAIWNTSNPLLKSVLEERVFHSKKFPFIALAPQSSHFEETKEIASELMSISLREEDIPCSKDIKRKKDFPPLILVSEMHSCPNCHVNMVKRALDVRDKKALLASEGHDYQEDLSKCDDISECSRTELPAALLERVDSKGAKILGIESEVDSYSSIIEALIELDGQSGSIAADPKNVLHDKLSDNEGYGIIFGAGVYTLTNPLLKAASQSLAEKDSNFNKEFYEPLLTLKDSISLILSEKNKDKDFSNKINTEVDKFIKKFSYEDLRKHLSLILKELRAQIANDFSPPEKAKRPLLLGLLKKENFSPKDLLTYDEILKVTSRNKEFALNIFKLYCEQAVPKGLPLYIQIGAAHVSGVQYLIQSALKDASLPTTLVSIKDEATEFLAMDVEKRKKHLKKSFERIEKRFHQ